MNMYSWAGMTEYILPRTSVLELEWPNTFDHEQLWQNWDDRLHFTTNKCDIAGMTDYIWPQTVKHTNKCDRAGWKGTLDHARVWLGWNEQINSQDQAQTSYPAEGMSMEPVRYTRNDEMPVYEHCRTSYSDIS